MNDQGWDLPHRIHRCIRVFELLPPFLHEVYRAILEWNALPVQRDPDAIGR